LYLIASGEIAGRDADRVKISFFGGLRFGRLERSRGTPDGAIEVASLVDLLSHKLKTVLQRVDYFRPRSKEGLPASSRSCSSEKSMG
jgi:hypothetical protein